MNAEQLSHEIIRLVYHEAVMSDDPIVQEACVQTSIHDLLEEFEQNIRAEEKSEEWSRNSDLRQAEDDVALLLAEKEQLLQEIHDLKQGQQPEGRISD